MAQPQRAVQQGGSGGAAPVVHLAGTGRSKEDAIGTVPTEQAPAFEQARAAIQPAAEEHVLDAVVPAWRAARQALDWRRRGMSPDVERLRDQLDAEMQRLPGEVVAELASPIGLGMAGNRARALVDEVLQASMLSRNDPAFAELRRQLAARSLIDGAAGRMQA